MTQNSKIKITDDRTLRNDIFEHYKTKNQKELSIWALALAKHILEKINLKDETIQKQIHVLEQWQEDTKTIAQVRQAALTIHALARQNPSDIERSALRTLGHAIASGHMKAHALVASDYAIQCINLITDHDIQASTTERTWQLKALQKSVNLNQD